MKVGDKVIVITQRFRNQAGGVGFIMADHGEHNDLRFVVDRDVVLSLPGVGRGALTYGEQDLQVIKLGNEF